MAKKINSLGLAALVLGFSLHANVKPAVCAELDRASANSMAQLFEGSDPAAPPVENCGDKKVPACDGGSCAAINAFENTTLYSCQTFQAHPGGDNYCRCVLPCQAENTFQMGPEVCRTMDLVGDPAKMNVLELLQLASQIEELRNQVNEAARAAAPSLSCTEPCNHQFTSVDVTRMRIIPPGSTEKTCEPAESKPVEASATRGICEENCAAVPKKIALAQKLMKQLNDLRGQFSCSDPNCTSTVQSDSEARYRFSTEPCEKRPLVRPCRLSLTVHGTFACVQSESTQGIWQLQICAQSTSRCEGRWGDR